MVRTYSKQQACPIARALGIIGDRWTLLLVRDLHRGHSRFADLLVTLNGISPTVLSDRLQLLEHEGLVTRSFYSEHPPRAEYVLTEKGAALAPVLRTLITWGEEYASVPLERSASPSAGTAGKRPTR
jgi:DNA-binding HxlR family transcriptional regulator